MPNFRPIFFVNGILLVFLGLFMLFPALADFSADASTENWQVFLTASMITCFVGVSSVLITRDRPSSLTTQQAFLLTTTVWLVLTAFGALPLYFSNYAPTYTDAFFEAMSGLTTTGSTVLTDLDEAPVGINLWRGLLQWLGGIGIIVMAIAILPMLQVGGMQLFKLESSDASEKILPRATEVASVIALIYVCFSFMCAFAYAAAGMDMFDATVHAMTTIATGGFSTHDESLGAYSSPYIHYTSVVFMILGSLPFVLYFQAVRGRPLALFRDWQVRWFFGILSVFVGIIFWYQHSAEIRSGSEAFQYALFNVTSIMTGTGYATDDYSAWGAFSVMVFFVVMFVGGCAGSTSCGIKIFRFQIMYQLLRVQMQKIIHPRGMFTLYYNGNRVADDVVSSVMSFLFMFFLCFAGLTICLSLIGLDTLTAFSAAATSIANVGPGLGEQIGPSGTFQDIPQVGKWLLCLGMLLGRLELFTVLVLFMPAFWRS